MSAIDELARKQRRNKTAKLVFDPRDPMPTARKIVELRYIEGGLRLLHHHRGSFFSWAGTRYEGISDETIRAAIWSILADAAQPGDEPKPFAPTRAKVGDVLDALRAATHLADAIDSPAWLIEGQEHNPRDLLACANGLLHLPTRTLLRNSPALFVEHAVDFDYAPGAVDATSWRRFLGELFGDDSEAIDTLQEIFGYMLTPDTSQQKLFLIVGPKRSGKGTIGRVVTSLLGRASVAGPTLASLSSNFGLASLIGRRLAIIADARLGTRTDQHAIAERLLSVSGEDAIDIDRKFQPVWTGRLSTRFLILTNELPRLADASGALASRFIVLQLTQSFYGREDPTLTDKLLSELPAILNWSLDGLDRLRARGHFVQPASSREAIEEIEDLGSPIGAFIRDRCIVGAGLEVACDELFNAYRAWCETQGRDHPGTVQTFGRDLRAAISGLTTTQPREAGRRERHYQGVALQ